MTQPRTGQIEEVEAGVFFTLLPPSSCRALPYRTMLAEDQRPPIFSTTAFGEPLPLKLGVGRMNTLHVNTYQRHAAPADR
jgi:hypothetical protein